MGKINLLDKHVAELIAAGEVVERPSSVIKELVENSIDAGAKAITVETKNGGITYMRISDNGCGIEKEDVSKAFLRNATSKVKLECDLEKISTLGFRGEALASVCAVAKLELITQAENEDIGTKYQINAGEEILFEDTGCPQGTTIIVRDLFYNVPARMKFLKKDISESNSIAKVMDLMALSHPDISFKYIRDGKQVLNTPGDGNLLSSIYSVYGKEFVNGLIEVNYALNGIKVTGFISKAESARANRAMQHFFINNRYVKSKTAAVALEEAFKGALMVQKFPCCVLDIKVPFETVDVNVHPSKIEVRFIDEKPIFSAVYHAIKSAIFKRKNEINTVSNISDFAVEERNEKFLDQGVKDIKPSNENQSTTFFDVSIKSASIANKSDIDLDSAPEVFIPKKEHIPAFRMSDSVNFSEDLFKINKDKPFNNLNDNFDTKTIISKNVLQPEDQPVEIPDTIEKDLPENEIQMNFINEGQDNFKIIGEAFDTYIIIEKNKELIYIDKHAAHERLIYEDLISKVKNNEGQVLLAPVIVNLCKDEYDAILSNLEVLKDAGFEVDDFGSGSVIIRIAPMRLDNLDIENTIIEMAGYILENKKDLTTAKLDWLYKNVACRAAIKAGNKIHTSEMFALIKKLIVEDVKHCPHGRPIFVKFPKSKIEKEFGRV